MFSIGHQIKANDAEGRVARGEVIEVGRGVGGGVLYYGVRNPVSGLVVQVYPATWDIRSA